MAQKVNPNLYRIGVQQMWKSLSFHRVHRHNRVTIVKEAFIRDVASGYLRSLGYLLSDVICQKSNLGYCVSAVVFPDSTQEVRNEPLKSLGCVTKQLELRDKPHESFTRPTLRKGLLANLLELRPINTSQVRPLSRHKIKHSSSSNIGLLSFTLSQTLSHKLKERIDIKLQIEKSYINDVAVIGQGLIASIEREPYLLNKHLSFIKTEFDTKTSFKGSRPVTKLSVFNHLTETVKKEKSANKEETLGTWNKVKSPKFKPYLIGKKGHSKLKPPFGGVLGLSSLTSDQTNISTRAYPSLSARFVQSFLFCKTSCLGLLQLTLKIKNLHSSRQNIVDKPNLSPVTHKVKSLRVDCNKILSSSLRQWQASRITTSAKTVLQV
jgi:hypothetical protein